MKSILLPFLFFITVAHAQIGPAEFLKTFQDSGSYANGVTIIDKEGKWVEYYIDSSMVHTKVYFGSSGNSVNLGYSYRKEIGDYSNNKRNGLWFFYKGDPSSVKIDWRPSSATTYKDNFKNGVEIQFQVYTENPYQVSAIQYFKHGVEDSLTVLYFSHEPYNLQSKYYTTNGKERLLEEYYPNGRLKTKFIDTLIENKQLKYLESYWGNGKLKQTGFYLNDTLFDGKWNTYYNTGIIESEIFYDSGLIRGTSSFFHSNGKLWTAVVYKDGKPVEVLCNYDKEGNKKDKGTLKNGTGTKIIYDEDGKIVQVQKFENGMEIK